jgi:hypothetical protein
MQFLKWYHFQEEKENIYFVLPIKGWIKTEKNNKTKLKTISIRQYFYCSEVFGFFFFISFLLSMSQVEEST